MASQLTINTNPPITILVRNGTIDIADSQTFFTDNLIITVPESFQIELAHGRIDENENLVNEGATYVA